MLRARNRRREAVESQNRGSINRRQPKWVRHRLHDVQRKTQTRRGVKRSENNVHLSEHHKRKQRRRLDVSDTLPRPGSNEELSGGSLNESPRKNAETRRGLPRTLTFLLASLARFVSSRV
jgi:hypothetical protein